MSIGRKTFLERADADFPFRRCRQRRSGDFVRLNRGTATTNGSQNRQFLDLLAEDDRLNVYGGEVEVRPPDAPTTRQLDGSSSLVRHLRFMKV